MQLTKRRLTDLWVVGREVVLDDGQGDPLTVWMQKLNPAEAVDANRRCDAQRAKVLMARNDHDGDRWIAVQSSVYEWGGGERDRIIDFLLSEERAKAQRSVEARLASDDEWSKENYLQGLFDAWREGLERRWLDDHDDEEAARCKTELDRFNQAVEDDVENEIHVLRDAWNGETLPQLEERMALRVLDMDATQAWLKELACCQIYFATREVDDHKQRYFADRAEVDTLTTVAFTTLRDAYANLEVDVAEGKDLPAPTDSSPLSEEPDAAETEPLSGPVGAAR